MKKINSQLTDYGIYIDHPHCIIVALHNGKSEASLIKSELVTHERFEGEGSDKTRSIDQTGGRQKQHQNKLNNEFRKFCKAITAQIHNANRILIMGPSDAKFELQKEIRKTKNLRGVFEEVKPTDKMSKGEVMRFVKKNFAD
ncbi:MAG TPA: hypothetical protein VE978_07720 [Chitinophagales bacterium]|nr:hypothetical protein [Chitinophagales bacterium]